MPSGRVFSVSVRRQLQINQFYMPKRINAETSTSTQNGGTACVTARRSGDPTVTTISSSGRLWVELPDSPGVL